MIEPKSGRLGNLGASQPGRDMGENAGPRGPVGVVRREVTNENSISKAAGRVGRRAGGLPPHAWLEGGPLNSTLTAEAAPRAEAAMHHAFHCARVAEDNKGRDVLVLDMRGITPLFDFQVLVTGTSRRQMHTLAEEIDAAMRGLGEKRLSIEGYQAAKWIVQDYGDIVVHVFDDDTRGYYGLEDLWADAPHLDWK